MLKSLHMSLFRYLIILGLATLLCWIALFAVVFFINPGTAGALAFIFFYLSLTFALVGTFSLLGYLLRWVKSREELPHKIVNVASRQSVLFTLLIVVALMLQSQRFLTWWNMLILVAVAGLVEMFFISYKKAHK